MSLKLKKNFHITFEKACAIFVFRYPTIQYFQVNFALFKTKVYIIPETEI